MNDKELLMMAARGVGIDGSYLEQKQGGAIVYANPPKRLNDMPSYVFWNPTADDAQAIKLAVELNIDITFNDIHKIVQAWIGDDFSFDEPYLDDKLAATRRAIVRAAAEIGSKL